MYSVNGLITARPVVPIVWAISAKTPKGASRMIQSVIFIMTVLSESKNVIIGFAASPTLLRAAPKRREKNMLFLLQKEKEIN